MNRSVRISWLAIVCAAVIAAQTSAFHSPAPALTDIRGVDDLEALFTRDSGKVRLVLLLSPT